LVLLFGLAQKRQAREWAVRDYRSLIVERIAFASVMAEGNQRSFEKLAAELKREIES